MTGGGALMSNVLLFGRVLRGAGLDVHPGRMLDAVTAIGWVGVRSRADLHATLRSLLVHRCEDLSTFDQVFDVFWRSHDVGTGGLPLFPLGERPRVIAKGVSGADVGLEIDRVAADTDATVRFAVGAYSAVEVSRTKDFAQFTEDEMRRAEAIVADIGRQLGMRRTRRWKSASAGAIDLQRVARRSLKHGGELVDLPRRERIDKPRPVIALCDVSGSMERYSRMLLQLVVGLARSSRGAEAFVFATRLTRVTRHVRNMSAGSARLSVPKGTSADRRPGDRGQTSVLTRTVPDWGGGTRIGESLRVFNLRWARRVMRNGPVVLIVSDGWDRGDPDLLRRELVRLRRHCRRLVWLNPLLGSASYQPLTRGMQAALGVIDDFLPAHNLASLEQLAHHLTTPALRQPGNFGANTPSTHREMPSRHS